MPSAGALPAPLITPIREQITSPASNNIDTSVFIEISTGTDRQKYILYFIDFQIHVQNDIVTVLEMW